MHYRVIHVKREQGDQKGESFALELEQVLNEAVKDGYKVQSIIPVENSGFMVGVMVVVEK